MPDPWEVIRRELLPEDGHAAGDCCHHVGCAPCSEHQALAGLTTLREQIERQETALREITALPEHESQRWEHGIQREAATHSLLWDAVRLARVALSTGEPSE